MSPIPTEGLLATFLLVIPSTLTKLYTWISKWFVGFHYDSVVKNYNIKFKQVNKIIYHCCKNVFIISLNFSLYWLSNYLSLWIKRLNINIMSRIRYYPFNSEFMKNVKSSWVIWPFRPLSKFYEVKLLCFSYQKDQFLCKWLFQCS